MLRRYALVVAALAAVCAPVVAAAQANAQFEGVDGFLLVRGGELYQPAHGLSEELEPGTRALPDLISAFRQYCLRARFMPQMIGFIDFPGQFDLDPRPITVATAGSQPFEVAGWHGGDVSMMIVNADDAPTGRQCTVTAATTANHPAQELFPAMNRVFGQPLNIDDIFNEDGSQNEGVRPIWLATNEMNGGTVFAFARSLSAGPGLNRTVLSMIQLGDE